MSAFIPFPHKRLENDPAGVKGLPKTSQITFF